MNFIRTIIISLGLICYAFSPAQSNERCKYSRNESKHALKMHKHQNRQRLIQQECLNKNSTSEPFHFVPRFKSETRMGQVVLGIFTFANFIQIVHSANNPPAQHFKPSTRSDCVVSPASKGCALATPSGHPGVSSSPALAAATISGLSEIFCPQKSQCAQLKDDQVIFTGSSDGIEGIERKFGDFSRIRENLIPPTPEAAKTQAHPEPQFDSPNDLLKSLGVPPQDLENMAVTQYIDCADTADKLGLDKKQVTKLPICTLSETNNNIMAISYRGAENGLKSFNQKTADSFITYLREESPFFKFLTDTNKGIITYTDQYIFMNIGIFNEYFSRLNPIKTRESWGVHSLTLPLESVLKRLMATVSGGISLEQTSIPGEFHVRTVTLKDQQEVAVKQSTPPIIKIVLDRSGSMHGESINTINTNMPILLNRFKDSLGLDDVLNITIYSLNDEFSQLQSFLLKKDTVPPKWQTMVSDGYTDLSPFGRLMKIEAGENPSQILVGITDGEHTTGPKLDANYYSGLKALQASGHFAQPFLCRVGSGPDVFFVDMNQMFSGSYSRETTIQDCLDRITQAIPNLLLSKAPLVLTIGGNNKVIWQQNAQSGIQRTTETVHEGDTIVLGQYKAKVNVETKEEKRARLRAELEALEKGEL